MSGFTKPALHAQHVVSALARAVVESRVEHGGVEGACSGPLITVRFRVSGASGMEEQTWERLACVLAPAVGQESQSLWSVIRTARALHLACMEGAWKRLALSSQWEQQGALASTQWIFARLMQHCVCDGIICLALCPRSVQLFNATGGGQRRVVSTHFGRLSFGGRRALWRLRQSAGHLLFSQRRHFRQLRQQRPQEAVPQQRYCVRA
ncbi:hypothetical protein BU23DRAFT_139924 [Bimuria novae-zelandiae CBS 107.79]|uniref:Uncharacterized protein n=1 Tax=Bimuria novae-zelandiae CBS 107.79 TaxID=1447943 RepID=A0A6A5V707_9PLEO|nr:hypothetical protein BU23DRAFT_139924 [Bimuria novae-zelandiae CBS 107.79]